MHRLSTLSNMPPDMSRITNDPDVMGGKPCIRGLRVTVGAILGLLASGQSEAEILAAYPYLEQLDIRAALSVQPRKWRSGGGMRSFFKRLKGPTVTAQSSASVRVTLNHACLLSGVVCQKLAR